MHTLHLIPGSCVQVFDMEICVVVGVLDFIVELKIFFKRCQQNSWWKYYQVQKTPVPYSEKKWIGFWNQCASSLNGNGIVELELFMCHTNLW